MMASDLPTELLVTILGHCDPVTLCHSRCVQCPVKLKLALIFFNAWIFACILKVFFFVFPDPVT